MNRLKKLWTKGINTYQRFKDPIKRNQDKIEFFRRMQSYSKVKAFFYFGGAVYLVISLSQYNYNFSKSISKTTGRIARLEIPKGLLTPMLSLYCKFYNVNTEEMLAEDLSQFNSFNEFFTRKLKPDCRTIDDKENPNSICSPCDGTVFNFGNCEEDTFVLVKGTTYSIDEFLFGEQNDSK